MLRKIIFTLIVFVSFVLQSSVFSMIPWIKTIPNLMIVVTACIGFMRGEKDGLFTGFFCGLLTDIFWSDFLGFHALLMMYIGYVNGKFCEVFYKEDIKLPLALVVSSDLTYGIFFYIFMFLLRGKIDFSAYLMQVILPEAVYTILITFFFYPIILKLNTMLESWERRSEQKFV